MDCGGRTSKLEKGKQKTKNKKQKTKNKKQDQLPKGSVVLPVILYSDETQAMNFGSKKFYPIYLSLGNINKSTRRKADAWILAGYLPVLTGSEAEKKRWTQQNMKGQILHKCLGMFLESLIEPAKR